MIKDVSIDVQPMLIDYGATVTAVVDETDKHVNPIEAECFDATGALVAGPFTLDVGVSSGNDCTYHNSAPEPLTGIGADDVVFAKVTIAWQSTATGSDSANSPASTVPSSKKKYPKKGKKGKKKAVKKKAKRKRTAASMNGGTHKKREKAVALKTRRETKTSPPKQAGN